MRVGIKIWSTNTESFPALLASYESGKIDFLELYYVPGSLNKIDFNLLEKIPVGIHAPHFSHDYNMASIPSETVMDELAFINSQAVWEYFVFHPGVMHGAASVRNTIANLNRFTFQNMMVETMPATLPFLNVSTVASQPNDFIKILSETNVGLCLDFSHVICSANAARQNPIHFLERFLSLQPGLFHFSDGDYNSDRDIHMHLGTGSFPLAKLAGMIPDDGMVLLETPKVDFCGLSEDLSNLRAFKVLSGCLENFKHPQ